jgi:hypothetical protein
MSEHQLDLRLQAVARSLDSVAPAFDPAALRGAHPRRIRGRIVGIAAALVLVGALAPVAVSGLSELFGVDDVKELGPVPADVAPPFDGVQVTPEAVRKTFPFGARTIPSLGTPHAAFIRNDIAGGMVSVTYDEGRIVLTQWPADRVDARIALVPTSGTAEDVKIGRLPALWIEGTARGTFTLIGADKGVHKERFDVDAGALLWRQDGVALLLQGAGSKERATKLAAEASR